MVLLIYKKPTLLYSVEQLISMSLTFSTERNSEVFKRNRKLKIYHVERIKKEAHLFLIKLFPLHKLWNSFHFHRPCRKSVELLYKILIYVTVIVFFCKQHLSEILKFWSKITIDICMKIIVMYKRISTEQKNNHFFTKSQWAPSWFQFGIHYEYWSWINHWSTVSLL